MTLYVSQQSTNPVPPYSSWQTAATNIQDAINAALPPWQTSTVVVTDGVYSVPTPAVSACVTVTNPLTLLSVNGPLVTTIKGRSTARGAYITTNAVLSGFTISNASQPSGNGAGIFANLAAIVTNCIITANTNNNSSYTGGGVFGGLLYNCVLSGNSSDAGGGAAQSRLFNCTLTGNSSLNWGGGAYQCLLSNCFVISNSAANFGGGDYICTNYNSVFAQNMANNGGGTVGSASYNCTVAFNSAASLAGGDEGGKYYNSIIYFNSAPLYSNVYTSQGTYNYCCTAPLPSGQGNITGDPMFVNAAGGDFRIKCGSPCIDAGMTNATIAGTTSDIRGVPRPLDGNGDGIAQIDMGAYEYDPDIDQSPSIWAPFDFSTVASGFAVPLVAQIGGCPDYFFWDFGDGVMSSNQLTVTHSWSTPGVYQLSLTAYYSALGSNLVATASVQVVPQPVSFVYAYSGSPAAPYTNWATASHTIQAAINAGTIPGRLVVVSNGNYGEMLQIPASVALTNVILRSVNGPQLTTIEGIETRCVYMNASSLLDGFTVTGGGIVGVNIGAGLLCEPGATITNCVISRNLTPGNGAGAYQGAFYNCTFSQNTSSAQGGGAFGAIMYDCALLSNTARGATNSGGGASQCTLYRCLLAGNSGASAGGGANQCLLYNCVISNNTASSGGGASSSTLQACTVISNSATSSGGGSYSNALWNCVVAGNRAVNGGGAYESSLYNCTVAANVSSNYGGLYSSGSGTPIINSIIYFNSATSNPNWGGSPTPNYSCTSPLPLGTNDITNAPIFMNLAACDLRLHFASAGIDAGTNLAPSITNDLAGGPRPLDGDGDGVAEFDMGAYEFNLLATVGTNWLISYGLDPADPLVFASDPDGDGFTTLQEWVADTNPTNASSFFNIESISNGPPTSVYFLSSSNRVYNLLSSPGFPAVWSPVPGQTQVPGSGGLVWLQDTNAAAQQFYRVSVGVP